MVNNPYFATCFSLPIIIIKGPIVYISNLGSPIIFLNSYETMVDLLEKRGGTYSSRPKNVMLDLFVLRDTHYVTIINQLILEVDGQVGLQRCFHMAMNLGSRGNFYTDIFKSTRYQDITRSRKYQPINFLITFYHHQRTFLNIFGRTSVCSIIYMYILNDLSIGQRDEQY